MTYGDINVSLSCNSCVILQYKMFVWVILSLFSFSIISALYHVVHSVSLDKLLTIVWPILNVIARWSHQ